MPEDRSLDAPEYAAGSATASPDEIYGSFWQRVAAAIIDGAILALPEWLLSLPLKGLSRPGRFSILTLFGIIIGWLYSAVQESSPRGATIGKRALGLRVTDSNLERISFARATGRYVARFVTALTLGIGYLVALFNDRRRTLHDGIADTVVIRSSEPLPRSSLVPLLVLSLLVGMLPLRGASFLDFGPKPCPRPLPSADEVSASARIPDELPVPSRVRVVAVERKANVVRVIGVLRISNIEGFLEDYELALPFEYSWDGSTVGERDGSLRFSGGPIDSAEVQLRTCQGGTAFELEARYSS